MSDPSDEMVEAVEGLIEAAWDAANEWPSDTSPRRGDRERQELHEAAEKARAALSVGLPQPEGKCLALLDFDGDVRVKYECSLDAGHAGPHEAWTSHAVTDNPLADRHAQWRHEVVPARQPQEPSVEEREGLEQSLKEAHEAIIKARGCSHRLFAEPLVDGDEPLKEERNDG